jgi:hypothetical protein
MLYDALHKRGSHFEKAGAFPVTKK